MKQQRWRNRPGFKLRSLFNLNYFSSTIWPTQMLRNKMLCSSIDSSYWVDIDSYATFWIIRCGCWASYEKRNRWIRGSNTLVVQIKVTFLAFIIIDENERFVDRVGGGDQREIGLPDKHWNMLLACDLRCQSVRGLTIICFIHPVPCLLR